MCDWLDPEVPIELLAEFLEMIALTPNLDWLLLTKRPENFINRLGLVARHVRLSSPESNTMALICRWGHSQPPPNVWIGATAENQEMADQRIPELLSIPARIRFLSVEPMLGPVSLMQHLPIVKCSHQDKDGPWIEDGYKPQEPSIFPQEIGIHWVICGGESGAKARPMHGDWVRSLRDQCQAAAVPFFFKQHGQWLHESQIDNDTRSLTHRGQDMHRFPDGTISLGVKDKGLCLLDGKTHKEFPEVRA